MQYIRASRDQSECSDEERSVKHGNSTDYPPSIVFNVLCPHIVTSNLVVDHFSSMPVWRHT